MFMLYETNKEYRLNYVNEELCRIVNSSNKKKESHFPIVIVRDSGLWFGRDGDWGC